MGKNFSFLVRYPPGITVFREEMLKLQRECDWHWQSAEGERLHFSEQTFNTGGTRSVWLVRHLGGAGSRRRGIILTTQPEGRVDALVNFQDGTDVGWSGGQAEPIGPLFEEFAYSVIMRLAKAWAALEEARPEPVTEETRAVAVIEDSGGERRTIGQQEYLDIIHDTGKMKKYYKDYAPATAKRIANALEKAFWVFDSGYRRWGPGVVSDCVTGVGATTVGRYLRAFWMSGLREIADVGIPYRPRLTKRQS